MLAWCSARKPFHGVLSLDECHRAKAAGSTSSGTAVLKLQVRPRVRHVSGHVSGSTSSPSLHSPRVRQHLLAFPPQPSTCCSAAGPSAGPCAARATAPERAVPSACTQAELPLARVVYASATAATELHNMQYLTRLGLWGGGTPYANFADFRDELQASPPSPSLGLLLLTFSSSSLGPSLLILCPALLILPPVHPTVLFPLQAGGAAPQELLPQHLKAAGAMASRLISYRGVRVSVAKHTLTREQRATYDAAAALWQDLNRVLRARASQLPPSSGSRFWSAHQRFFRLLVTSAKLPTLHALMREGLAQARLSRPAHALPRAPASSRELPQLPRAPASSRGLPRARTSYIELATSHPTSC